MLTATTIATNHTRMHTIVLRLFWICPELPRWASTRKVKTRKVKAICIYWS